MQVTLTTEGPGEISVYAQDIALTVRCVVQRVDARHWRLSAQDWKANAWHHQAVIDIYPRPGCRPRPRRRILGAPPPGDPNPARALGLFGVWLVRPADRRR